MDAIASEAPVGAFAIGPSTALGRAVALRVLFCGSAARLRYRLAAALRVAAAWLHPRDNTRGILLAVCAVALLLRGRRGRAGLRARVQSAYRRKFWRNMMRAALTYEEWAHAARMLEREAASQRASDADLYDEELVRNKLRELRHRRQEGSLRDIVFCMRADLLRNLGNMCNPELHKGRLQVPRLIKEYIEEVSTQLKMLAELAEMEIKHRCNQVLELGFPLGGLAKLFAQDWEGDVTVVMPATLAQYSKMIQNPSYAELQKAANQGRRCTWEKLSAIRANCAIELALDECVSLLNHLRRLKRSAERASASQGHGPTIRLCPSRRIPSWNLIARENSTGSLDEEMLASPTRTNQQGHVGVAGLSNRNQYLQRITHDSDSESESIDLHSWTRNGGPLMRTTSANKFISFVQNLEIDTEFRTIPSREDEPDLMTPNSSSLAAQAVTRESIDRTLDNSGLDMHDTGTPRTTLGPSTSIVVSEGDLLQPEKIENGILFNVVRRDTLLGSSSGAESQGSPREPDVETIQPECLDGVSASEDDDMEPDDDEAADPMRRNNLQHQGSSLEENVCCPSSLNREDETNTNNPEASSIFDICTENSLPEASSVNTELETAKMECADDNSAGKMDGVL
nr:unnamed protein product [Digitaria exilis]